MITADTIPVFPTCPAYGFSVTPLLLVKKTSLESGRKRRDRKWEQGLRRYEGMPVGEKPQGDIEAILNFFWSIGGESVVFRLKDWTDYKSCALDDSVTPLDQPFVERDESPAGFQLVKVYQEPVSGLSMVRRVSRPVGSTVRVANELGAEQAASRWTLDEGTGILVPGGSFAGTPASWGGEFDVPVAFDGSPQIEITNKRIQSASVTIEEDRDPLDED